MNKQNKNINLKINKLLNQKNCDCLIVINNYDIYYLTKFWDHENNSFLLIGKDRKYFITDGRFINQVKELNLDYKLISVLNNKTKFEVISDLIDINNYKNILVSHIDLNYKNSLLLHKKNLIDLDKSLINLRKEKSKEEIRNIKKACDIAEKAFLITIKKIKVGMSEIQIKNTIEDEMKNLGSLKESFPTIVASGPNNGAKPHAIPTERKVKEGDLITIDFGAEYNHYVSDITRTICIGDISDKQKFIYNKVLETKKECEKLLKPGVETKVINNKAEEIINKVGEKFLHSVGHGIGIQVHELPALTKLSNDKLEINDIHTIEPGIYINGVGGVRIEDDYLITSNGYECLTKNITTELIKI